MSDDKQQHNSKSIGVSMIWAMWILVIVLLTLFFNNILKKQHNPNQNVNSIVHNNGERVVTLQRNRFGQYVTNGKINQQQVVFMVDTGATDISIPAKVATRLGLKKGATLYFETANGTAEGYKTNIDSVSLGDISLTHIRASINPNVEFEEVLLGMAFLKHLEFTQRGDKLIIKQYKTELR